MEKVKGKEWTSTEKAREEDQQASNQPNTIALPGTSAKGGTKGKVSVKGDKVLCPKKKADCDNPRPQKKIPIPPLPSKLPPVNLIHRDIVRAWCQQLKLSTRGQKLDAYKRLCAFAYPNQKDFPSTAKEAKIRKSLQNKLKVEKGKASLQSSGTQPPQVALPPAEGLPALEGSTALLEGVNTVVVTTSAPEAVLASWARISARARTPEAVEPPQEASGVRWCVVHGKSLPADTDGWVHLQFHAGQAWVPEKQEGRVSALFLLPASSFPPPHLEDNMLCPKCVHRNKVLIKSLQWE
ncbi:developmental pluripotency-associated protein 4 [Sapajus apella]|uniref:Developmental pluripotency-associated protein 4 n=1 Tax=Sapajus apella TaxID=9515 RepID=A0A6J3JJL6_SAPAP|nr:developmental pluripotency-associated protein 4 [Sapajus apella]